MTTFWVDGIPYLHTALDDLESFLWVLLFTVLHIAAEKRLERTIFERHWFKRLQSGEYEWLHMKGGIMSLLKLYKSIYPKSLSRPVSLFADLCISWWEVCLAYDTAGNPTAEWCFEAFRKYMLAGLDCLESLRGKAWEEGGAD